MPISSISDSVYAKLPIFLQNVACSYYGRKEVRIRFGDLFHRLLEELVESEKWSAEEIKAYQDEKLSELITYSYESVPYYRDLMNGLKLTPRDIKTRDDLTKLPVLTKEDVRNNLHNLISEKANKRELIARHTSGTTGKSLRFFSGKPALAFQWAVWWRHRKRFGIDFGTWHANFTGKLVVPPEQSQPPYWRWNRPMQQVLINMHHLVPSKIADIVSFLNQHPFDFYSGYPSIIHMLALNGKEVGITLDSPPKAIFTGAENILDYQRRDIQEYTGAVLTDQYGTSEGCGNASQCPEFIYHEDFEFGIIECDQPSAMENGRQKGRIVCTGFASPEFPLIRYDVGDSGIWEDEDRPCACGRESRMLVDIEGRMDDYVVTPEGRHLMRFDYIFKDTDSVKESQIVQEKLGEIKVYITRRPSYTARDEKFVMQEIHKWISPLLKVKFEYVDEIQRESNGKFRAVKSLLKGT